MAVVREDDGINVCGDGKGESAELQMWKSGLRNRIGRDRKCALWIHHKFFSRVIDR